MPCANIMSASSSISCGRTCTNTTVSPQRMKIGPRIGADTLNRHLTFLGQIFRHLAARGVGALAAIEIAPLRSKGKKGRARDERVKLPFDQAAAIFRTAPFNGCAAWDLLGEARLDGPHMIFHCGLYFIPLLLY